MKRERMIKTYRQRKRKNYKGCHARDRKNEKDLETESNRERMFERNIQIDGQ